MPAGKLGELGVVLQQAELEDCGGKLDLAFVTEKDVHLVEMKQNSVTVQAVKQLSTYMTSIRRIYPDHEVRGYLVGKVYVHRTKVLDEIGAQPIRVLLFGIHMPDPHAILVCKHCGSAYGDMIASCGCGKSYAKYY